MEYNRVSAKRLIAEEAILLLLTAMITIILSLALEVNSVSWWIGFSLVAVFLLLTGLVYLPLLWRASGWKISDDNLYIKRGVIFTNYSYIPIKQMVNVVVVKNPLTPILGTASIVVKATAAKGRIRGIDLKTSQELAARLSTYKES